MGWVARPESSMACLVQARTLRAKGVPLTRLVLTIGRSRKALRPGEKEVRTWLIPPPCDGYLAPRQIKPVPPLLFLGPWRFHLLHVVCRDVDTCRVRGRETWIYDTSVCGV
jgi:hypothetical protein